MKASDIFNLYPISSQELLNAGGRDLVEKLGIEAIRQVILAVMKGENLRNRTELLTRKKIALSNGALIVFFLKGLKSDPHFLEMLPERALTALKEKSLTKQQKWIINWMLGLTDKAVQNVLRDDVHGSTPYHKNYHQTLKDASKELEKEFGKIGGSIFLDTDQQTLPSVDWMFVLHLLGAAGTQAMTIRGSDKSTYGKLFEKLILSSLLHILGFRLVDLHNNQNVNMVFWLSDKKQKRESDATALIEAGIGIRFDIGFIGRGNTEISLDKVSRFEREMELGRSHHTMATFIIVDRIGAKSKISKLAAEIGGTIVQMSMSYWPREVAKQLASITGSKFKHDLISMNKDSDVEDYLSKAIQNVPLKDLLPADFGINEDGETED